MEWLTSVKRQQIADTEHNDAGYIYHNGKRIAALEEIRKIVQKGEFDQSDDEIEKEQARWQQEIYKLCCMAAPGANIDGAGCDSGDPLDFSLSEIKQALNWLIDQKQKEKAAEEIIVRYQSACSGMWYENREAAGSISAVRINDHVMQIKSKIIFDSP